jgi:hypothetical protein
MTQRRCLNWRAKCIAVGASLGVATAAMAFPGYLAVVGPVPLRFYTVAKPAVKPAAFVLPAPKPEPAPAVVLPAVKPTVAPAPVPTPAPTTAAVLPVPEPVPAQPVFPPAGPPEVISPQMFLQFFSHSTNGTGSVAMPYVAPPQAPPGQSSATFSTGP